MRPGVTSAVLVIVIICLAAVDRFLAAVESAEVKNTAARSYLSGSRLLEQGKTNEAIDFLRDAHALERQNPAYELQLITALTTAGKIAEAEPLLTDILQRAPNDGRANLSAARLMIRKGNTAEAEAYYHRAIYGEWSGDPLLHRVPVRLELIDLLLQKNKKPELLPELISLEAESPTSGPIQKRLAELFLLAGSPSRAANVYAAIVEKNPKDISAYEGLGEAELEEGQYRAAHTAFLRAFLLDPNNASVRAHLQTADRLHFPHSNESRPPASVL
jgi:tetratricopeptide (TPR) repeat protein